MKDIILVAYYFRPFKGVGALRLSYWFDKLIEDGYNVKVITSIPQSSSSLSNSFLEGKIIYIPVKKSRGFDSSYQWGKSAKIVVRELLKNCPSSVVVITGGPYLHMNSILSLKKQYPASSWIIDYRDPLSNNPRNKRPGVFGLLLNNIKKIYEYIINKRADLILTVNDVCKNLIISKKDKILTIDNGYDERYFYPVKSKSENRFIYPGQIYDIQMFVNLCMALNFFKSFRLDYLGPSEVPCDFPWIKSYGLQDYSSAANMMLGCEYGIIFTSGKSFESTTKVFDYFAAKLKILIITQGVIKTGNLYEIVKNNPNVEWAENNVESIMNAIEHLKRPYEDWEYSDFSRYNGYLKLKHLIENI